ncbi:hypothetical protein VCB98_11710 [Gammaproteobacteria bacterium AB-CW1]|uniref:Zinc-finger domain-containing protein n=1 Tax=Natronospira elongata TaxID=3110268 RepID=A0AAP6JG94_9GAMM|nr:hypothetical protein [Gammaproteobacteria bacterium AB-CW1]
MLNCRQASELLSRSRDEELRWTTRLRLRAHVVFCRCCSSLERNFDTLGGLIQDKSADEADEQWTEDLAEKISRQISQQSSEKDQSDSGDQDEADNKKDH